MKLKVLHSFTLITDDHRRYDFAAGEQEIPEEIADHWYVKAHIEPVSEVYDAPEAEPELADAPETRKAGRPKKV